MNTTSLSALTENQKAEATRIITDAARKSAAASLNRLSDAGVLDNPAFQKKVIESSDFASEIQSSFQSTIELSIVAATRSWHEKDGIIYFTVVSDGTTGQQWIERLKKKGIRLSKWAKDVLGSRDFKPTKGVVYKIAVLKGSLFSDTDRETKKIREYASERKLTTPNAEVACLIRENFSDEDIKAMGLWWIVTMHAPIKDSGGGLRLLFALRYDDEQWLDTARGSAGRRWRVGIGFAFVGSQDQNSDSVT